MYEVIIPTKIMDCKQCGKVFFGRNAIYCSMECYKEHVHEQQRKEKNASNSEQ